MKRLKSLANNLRIVADELEHGVTKTRANELCEELEQMAYQIDFRMNGKEC